MSRHFAAPIVRHGLAQRLRNAAQFARKTLHHAARVQSRQACKHHQARNQSRLDFRGSRCDRHGVRNLAAFLAIAEMSAAYVAVLSQTTDQSTSQLAARNDVNRRIDGLVGDALAHVPRVIALQPRCNLLRRPSFTQAPTHAASQPSISQFASSACNPRPPLRTPLGTGGPGKCGRGISPRGESCFVCFSAGARSGTTKNADH